MQNFLDAVTAANNAVNGVVWGVPALALLAFLLYMLFRPYKEATRLTEKVRTNK